MAKNTIKKTSFVSKWFRYDDFYTINLGIFKNHYSSPK
ncbi:hypothetical protein TREAZ_3054 [Leadbettera azotonutricia ZAS-9]|uniref:Uncharacterized protein n=1 Tax=Leadbettera azotonutricia (strain ATCC BAA-888 / DSM 13862 / ZAS-9) TaxID=545695 RepID=F5YB15_LEAAZ|nr:hypothetical protein TREAZ_3054 [Leadbettera azotonutricia ZAS-9]